MQARLPVATCHNCSPTPRLHPPGSTSPGPGHHPLALQASRAEVKGKCRFCMSKAASSVTRVHTCSYMSAHMQLQTSAFYAGFRNKDICSVSPDNSSEAIYLKYQSWVKSCPPNTWPLPQ